jgi:tetratricopeptide (TPR) repeat protein
VLLELGDVAAAGSCFERALTLAPCNGSYYWNLAFSRSGHVDNATLDAMERLSRESDALPPVQAIELRFALACTYEARARYDESFGYLKTANSLKRVTLQYNEDSTLRLFGALEKNFTHLFACAELRNCGNPSTRPIFVFGMPRSGTTLVEQLLSVHPSVSAGGELQLFERTLEENWLPVVARSTDISIEDVCAIVRTVGDRYLNASDAFAGLAARTTDKQPHNFCYAPMINLALPNARMIHVKRNGIDTCMSCFATLFADDSITYSYDLGELGRYYNGYDRMMSAWRKILPANRFLEVDYETLVVDFEKEARRIVAFCDLPWDARILNFHEARRPIRTASRVQVRRPLYRSSVGRASNFAAHLKPLTDVLTA